MLVRFCSQPLPMGASRSSELASVQGQLRGWVSTWRLVGAFAGGGAHERPRREDAGVGVSQARVFPLEPLRHPQFLQRWDDSPGAERPFL